MTDDPRKFKNGQVFADGLRLVKDPETEALDRAERVLRSLEKIKQISRSMRATPEERRALFKVIHGDRQ